MEFVGHVTGFAFGNGHNDGVRALISVHKVP